MKLLNRNRVETLIARLQELEALDDEPFVISRSGNTLTLSKYGRADIQILPGQGGLVAQCLNPKMMIGSIPWVK